MKAVDRKIGGFLSVGRTVLSLFPSRVDLQSQASSIALRRDSDGHTLYVAVMAKSLGRSERFDLSESTHPAAP